MKNLIVLSFLVIATLACQSGQSDTSENDLPKSIYWDTVDDVRGGEGYYIWKTRDLSEAVASSDLVAVVEVSGIKSIEYGSPLSGITVKDPADQGRYDRFAAAMAGSPHRTYYDAEVTRVIQGEVVGESIVVWTGGGVDSGGSISVLDGSFLLEPGRTYLLSMVETDSGAFFYEMARANFDLTDGVNVLNHPETRDLEHFEELTVDDLVEHVANLSEANASE